MIIFISIVIGALAIAVATIPVLVAMHLHHQESLGKDRGTLARDAVVTVARRGALSPPREVLIANETARRSENVTSSI